MFNVNIKDIAKENTNFRKVIFTGKNSQVVLMSIPQNGDIGNEVHETIDQFFVFVEGVGEVIINNSDRQKIEKHSAVFIPAGTWHNIINTRDEDLKLFTVYSPPAHKDGTIHKTKEEAEAEENKTEY